jgi:hypothetical protein
LFLRFSENFTVFLDFLALQNKHNYCLGTGVRASGEFAHPVSSRIRIVPGKKETLF